MRELATQIARLEADYGVFLKALRGLEGRISHHKIGRRSRQDRVRLGSDALYRKRRIPGTFRLTPEISRRDEIERLTDAIEDLESDLEDLFADKDKLRLQISVKNAEIQALGKEIRDIGGDIERANNELKKISFGSPARIRKMGQIASYKLSISLKNKKIDKLPGEIRELEGQISDMRPIINGKLLLLAKRRKELRDIQ